MPSNQFRSLLENPRFRETLSSIAAANRQGPSADEFIAAFGLPIQNSGKTGYAALLRLGLKSKASQKERISVGPTVACMSLCMVLANLGIKITEIAESDDALNYIVLGVVPSSPLHWQGTFEASVSQNNLGAVIALDVAFPGQLIAWGAGSKLLKKIKVATVAISEQIKAASGKN